jgi:hypothetical protein
MKNNISLREKLLPITLVSLILNLLLSVKFIVPNLKRQVSSSQNQTAKTVVKADIKDNLFDEINPVAGFQINAKFGNLGPKMVKNGVIDLQKFRDTYAKSGQSLTAEQEKILTTGLDENITINRDNSYFLLNFFWAVGLNNKSAVLDEGEITKYGGRADLGNFASTGGWTLAKSDAMNYYSSSSLITLNKQQQDLVNRVAGNVYRPCCNNSTAFPDCNHGMALLGVLELMASSGSSEDEMYKAAKYFNAYWFPGNYYDLALYFKNNQGKNFADIDPKIILSKDYSSASGWQAAKKWLISKGLQQEPPKQGGGCGV